MVQKRWRANHWETLNKEKKRKTRVKNKDQRENKKAYVKIKKNGMEENKRLEIIKKSHHSCIIKPWKHSYQSNHKRKLLAKPQSQFTIP